MRKTIMNQILRNYGKKMQNAARKKTAARMDFIFLSQAELNIFKKFQKIFGKPLLLIYFNLLR